ncbi:MAG: transferrin receptor-like dimerization domain-containing protein [Steroidobacteraceae bacterium]|jgi:N-acetylated-alpha-linked acidic dipeptidase
MSICVRRRWAALSLGLFASAIGAAAGTSGADSAPGAATMLGFSAAGASAEAQLEQRFDADLSAEEERAWLQRLSAAPNQVGSAHNKDNAEFILAKFREWGWDASLETFSVLYPTPRELRLELTAPTRFVAKLREPPVEGDASSSQTRDELPPYNIYGADGDVSGELVYVNQGMPDDYAELERRGISVKGRIVIVRYGGGWRGLKPKLAYQHGAIGCLIYSDPLDDGYGRGDVYPNGGFRPADAVQRGSVLDILQYTGDPLTPGIGSTQDAKRLAIADAKTILKIPVLPISYADAEPLLAALGGQVVPAAWRGALPFAYHIGPGAARVHLKIASDWGQKTLYDVIAKLPGAVEPDRWIIRGNHHDAWVFGASDPLSGTVALMSEAKAIGRLVQSGWRPRRTLIYASWDGEEPGLIGSTEWAEAHAAELQAKAALYVNSDNNARGTLRVGGTHALQHFISEVARDVKDPETDASVLSRAVAARRVHAYEAGHDGDPSAAAVGAGAPGDLHLGALGSGSDYTPFLQHLGISSVDFAFGGESDYGVYHSAYDSFDHFRRFVDPQFAYEVVLAKIAGRTMLRAAQADLLPTRAADFARSIGQFDEELHQTADRMRTKTRDLDALLDAGVFALAADVREARAAPQRSSDVPYLDFAPLDNAVERLKASSEAFDLAYARACIAQDAAAPARRERINAMLTILEETLTDARGLPTRPWYKHMIYAPGQHTGYEAKTLPAVREAIEDRRWAEANEYLAVVSDSINAYRAQLERVIASL